jgi:uncharacterized protein (UPF0332 family)
LYSHRPPDFDPYLFLEFAEKAQYDNDYDKVTRLRVSVGRAYYAAFLKSRDKLETFGEKYDPSNRLDEGKHMFVINRLKARNNTTGDFLAKLRGMRTQADYKMEAQMGSNTAKWCIKLSKNIFRDLSNMR